MPDSLKGRISYLRGLMEGLDVDAHSSEGKLISEIIEILDEMQAEIKALHTRIDETEDYVDALDEDLQDVELLLFEDDGALYEEVDDEEACPPMSVNREENAEGREAVNPT